MRKVIVLVIAALLVFGSSVWAEVRLPGVIGEHMVLQQRSKVALWGWANPGEKVTVKAGWEWWDPFGHSVKAGKDGKWQVKLKTGKGGGPYKVTIKAENEIVLEDVLLGEVWVCSGQSNMEWYLREAVNGEEEVAAANWPEIRLFAVPKDVARQPKEDCTGQWVACAPEMARTFTAVGYCFGRRLHKDLDVPVGLIGTYWGGTTAEAWTRREVLGADPKYQAILDRQQWHEEHFDEVMANWEKRHAEWEKAAEQARTEGKAIRGEPSKPIRWHQNSPSSLYNAMLAPVIPYGIRGVIWYQGESNVGRAYQYRTLFPAMIECWRTDWGRGDFPFYFVQIAPFRYRGGANWLAVPELREAQFMTLGSAANTGMVVITDVGDPNNIHPRDKKTVGERLALWALAKTYGQKGIVCSGPLYKSIELEGNKVRVRFDYVGSGLQARGGELTHWEIAGEDRQYVPGQAVIAGDTVVVSSVLVPLPVAVRYGWGDAAEPNLFNKEGLPASPFRTDDWPRVTAEAR